MASPPCPNHLKHIYNLGNGSVYYSVLQVIKAVVKSSGEVSVYSLPRVNGPSIPIAGNVFQMSDCCRSPNSLIYRASSIQLSNITTDSALAMTSLSRIIFQPRLTCGPRLICGRLRAPGWRFRPCPLSLQRALHLPGSKQPKPTSENDNFSNTPK